MNYLIDRELFENYSEFEDEYEREDKQKVGFLSKLGKGKAAAVGAMMRIINLINPLPEPAIPPKPVPTETRNRKPSGGQGEFEWELEAEIDRVRSRDAELMEYLGRAATETESEAEAAAFIGALIPIADRIISSTKPVLTRNSPALMRGLVAATQALRRHPDTRPLVRTIPTIVRRTAASMNQQLRQGMPVTQKTALQSLARQTQALLSSPQKSIQTLKRSQAAARHYSNLPANSEFDRALEMKTGLLEQEQLPTNRNSREYIRWIQSSLNQILGISLVVDGIMGPQTRNAIRRFQNLAGLQVDGIVGPKTEAALVSFNRKSGGFGQTIPAQTRSPVIRPCPPPSSLPSDFHVIDSYGKDSHALQHHQSESVGYYRLLDRLFALVQQIGCPKRIVKLIGHTSLEGDIGHNERLGQKRADYLRDRLIKDLRARLMRDGWSFKDADNAIQRGLDFRTSSLGENQPVALPDPISGEETEADKRRNRRVEVTF